MDVLFSVNNVVVRRVNRVPTALEVVTVECVQFAVTNVELVVPAPVKPDAIVVKRFAIIDDPVRVSASVRP